jgi:membrane protein implicated in regulation of membrane protease activity
VAVEVLSFNWWLWLVLGLALLGVELFYTPGGHLAQEGNTLIVPASISDVSSMIAMAMNVIRQGQGNGQPTAEPR